MTSTHRLLQYRLANPRNELGEKHERKNNQRQRHDDRPQPTKRLGDVVQAVRQTEFDRIPEATGYTRGGPV